MGILGRFFSWGKKNKEAGAIRSTAKAVFGTKQVKPPKKGVSIIPKTRQSRKGHVGQFSRAVTKRRRRNRLARLSRRKNRH